MGLLIKPYRALVIGASGAIGSAFVELLENDPDCSFVAGIHRQSEPSLDYEKESTIAEAAKAFALQEPFHLIINATGVLHQQNLSPEKKLDDLNIESLMYLMKINAVGPALTIRHFSKLLDPAGAVMALISAKVGSIEDNRLGGWYGYRASKAALNMLIKTAAIELKRTKPHATMIALHPGTVTSNLSKPFGGERVGRPALVAAQEMLNVLQTIQPIDTGSFLSYSSEKLPW